MNAVLTATANLTSKTAALSLAAVLWTLRATWAVTKWLGRVSLWVFLFPVGVLRSINHGANKRQKRHLDALREMHAETLAAAQRGA
jgi:hypothetical protein